MGLNWRAEVPPLSPNPKMSDFVATVLWTLLVGFRPEEGGRIPSRIPFPALRNLRTSAQFYSFPRFYGSVKRYSPVNTCIAGKLRIRRLQVQILSNAPELQGLTPKTEPPIKSWYASLYTKTFALLAPAIPVSIKCDERTVAADSQVGFMGEDYLFVPGIPGSVERIKGRKPVAIRCP